MMDFVQNLVAISLLMFKIIEFLRKSSFIIKKTVKKFWLWIFKKLRYVIKGRVGNVASLAMNSKIFVFIFGKLISCKRQNNFINYHHITIYICTDDTQCYRILYKNNLQLTRKTNRNKQSTITTNHTWKKRS